MEKKLFLGVYEFRKKFRSLIKKILKGKNTAQRELSACVEERFNGFGLVKKLAENLIRQSYKPIDIVYKPVSKINQIINCYFTPLTRNTHRVVYGKNNVSTIADQCFDCNKFFIERKSLERHECLWRPQQVKKFTILMKMRRCSMTFHPSLNIEKIPVVRSFNHTFEQLNDVSYLSDEILPYFDPITTRQLRDCAAAVFTKTEKYSLIEMFSCELKFVIDLLKKWLAEKYFSRYKELDLFSKQRFERENFIDWNETNFLICGFCLANAA